MTVFMRSFLLIGSLLALLVGCGVGGNGSGSQIAHGPDTLGWTGRTVVVGSHSTIAGNAVATEQQQKWQLNPNR
jgi:hypothetical protein